jgi:hypothetical protein
MQGTRVTGCPPGVSHWSTRESGASLGLVPETSRTSSLFFEQANESGTSLGLAPGTSRSLIVLPFEPEIDVIDWLWKLQIIFLDLDWSTKIFAEVLQFGSRVCGRCVVDNVCWSQVLMMLDSDWSPILTTPLRGRPSLLMIFVFVYDNFGLFISATTSVSRTNFCYRWGTLEEDWS